MSAGLSRRGLLGGGLAAGGVALAAGGYAAGRLGDDATAAAGEPASYPFRGERQAGIVTAAQDRLHFAAFDVVTDDRDELVELLRRWTDAAERMVQGQSAGPVGAVNGAQNLPPDDTGEALDLPPSRLTITIGFGPGLFEHPDLGDRFGLADRRPAALADLPHFPADVLDPARSGGDLCVQACADDPQVAVHAVRNLARIGFGTVSVRWSQLGFGRTSTTTTSQSTPRNLFGFKDGTMNVRAEEGAALDEHVWVGADDDAAGSWLAGGSYLVARRIAMTIEVWDRQQLGEQEQSIGRFKGSGGPLSGGAEDAQPDFGMQGSDGPVMPVDSHVAVVHPDRFGGARMLRRGYNFVDGSTDVGGLDAGLFFIAFVRDPRTHFIPLQTEMARNDRLMEYLRFTSSALFAVPPGAREGEFVGQALFA
ncbi:deferrochelatase/peroxidase EfeB [Nocardioides zeae]|uniref:Deferrochelatase/peroxidase EfeB n=1 Tax=Nocardioides zeae TaxID=1457234 RepID=A0ACC6IKN6_9ACTN|nr:iron uptake transporter deferrochelatase/peroxidase subunit [Nocardioides zeae]MDR6175264.1 deferrochelatase/peroxidase EfeB [Nocardioides zeae]MDR6211244.1 deferrochelatase/peroxidase EfeB [Nocardioides zeae]